MGETEKNKYRTRIKSILTRSDKGISECKGPMAMLWRTILCDIGMGVSEWNQLLIRYLEEIKLSKDLSPSQIANDRGGLTRRHASPELTYNVLLKGLKFLEVTSATLTVTMKLPDGKEITQSANIIVDPAEALKDTKQQPVAVARKRFLRGNRAPILSSAQPKSVSDILEAQCKLASSAKGGLSRIWRQTLFEMDISVSQWGSAMNILLDECGYRKKSTKKKANTRGNLKKELAKSSMSIKVFLKGMRILRIDDLVFTLTMKRKGEDRFTIHEISYKTPSTKEIFNPKGAA